MTNVERAKFCQDCGRILVAFIEFNTQTGKPENTDWLKCPVCPLAPMVPPRDYREVHA